MKAELSSAKESRLKFFHRSRQITGYCKNLIVVHIVPVIFLLYQNLFDDLKHAGVTNMKPRRG